MALDLETNRFITDTEFEPNNGTGLDESFSKQKHSWKKSILLEGMINPTGTGARLGVIKATDANTGKSMGRIQARRKDDVSFEDTCSILLFTIQSLNNLAT